MFWIIALIGCVYCLESGARCPPNRKSDMKKMQRQMIDSWAALLDGDKDDSCWEAVCLSGAVIETEACLMCWLYYEFTDSMMEISGLHYDLHHQKKKNLFAPRRKARRGSCEPVSEQIGEATRDRWLPRINASIWSVTRRFQRHHLFLIEWAGYGALKSE